MSDVRGKAENKNTLIVVKQFCIFTDSSTYFIFKHGLKVTR